VIFTSVKAEEHESERRALTDCESRAFRRVTRSTTRLSVRERQRLVAYLEVFYERRFVPYRQRLAVRPIGSSASQLYCLGSELAHMVHDGERKILLHANRAEMRKFMEYLKRTFFNNS
jgi:hypothetical protein